MKKESYSDRKKLIEEYENLDVELKKRLKEIVKYDKKGVNPVRLYNKIVCHIGTYTAISEVYGLYVEDISKIKDTKAK